MTAVTGARAGAGRNRLLCSVCLLAAGGAVLVVKNPAERGALWSARITSSQLESLQKTGILLRPGADAAEGGALPFVQITSSKLESLVQQTRILLRPGADAAGAEAADAAGEAVLPQEHEERNLREFEAPQRSTTLTSTSLTWTSPTVSTSQREFKAPTESPPDDPQEIVLPTNSTPSTTEQASSAEREFEEPTESTTPKSTTSSGDGRNFQIKNSTTPGPTTTEQTTTLDKGRNSQTPGGSKPDQSGGDDDAESRKSYDVALGIGGPVASFFATGLWSFSRRDVGVMHPICCSCLPDRISQNLPNVPRFNWNDFIQVVTTQQAVSASSFSAGIFLNNVLGYITNSSTTVFNPRHFYLGTLFLVSVTQILRSGYGMICTDYEPIEQQPRESFDFDSLNQILSELYTAVKEEFNTVKTAAAPGSPEATALDKISEMIKEKEKANERAGNVVGMPTPNDVTEIKQAENKAKQVEDVAKDELTSARLAPAVKNQLNAFYNILSVLSPNTQNLRISDSSGTRRFEKKTNFLPDILEQGKLEEKILTILDDQKFYIEEICNKKRKSATAAASPHLTLVLNEEKEAVDNLKGTIKDSINSNEASNAVNRVVNRVVNCVINKAYQLKEAGKQNPVKNALSDPEVTPNFSQIRDLINALDTLCKIDTNSINSETTTRLQGELQTKLVALKNEICPPKPTVVGRTG